MTKSAHLLATGLIVAGVAAPAQGGDNFVFFRTPSHNITCVQSDTQGGYLRCDIGSRLKPQPPKPHGCTLDWGFGYTLRTSGRARITCAGDSTNALGAKVIRYGATWRLGPFRCTSKRVGLRCRNRTGHGFFLSREHSYRF